MAREGDPNSERPDWQLLADSLARRFVIVEHELTLGGRGYRLLKPRSPDELISEEDFNRDERLPYWADVWPSALCLAERVSAESGQGRRFLELGCGIGYVCAVAIQQGFQVLATDYYAESLAFTCLNARRNDLPDPETRLVDWRSFPSDLDRFDLVVAADVLYEKEYPALVAAALAQTLASTGLGLVADPGRRGAVPFVDECAARELRVHKVLTAPFDNGSVCHTVDLYELHWR